MTYRFITRVTLLLASAGYEAILDKRKQYYLLLYIGTMV